MLYMFEHIQGGGGGYGTGPAGHHHHGYGPGPVYRPGQIKNMFGFNTGGKELRYGAVVDGFGYQVYETPKA